MKVDPKIEEPLRRAYVAVIDKNVDGIAPELEPLDEGQMKTCVGYAVYVVRFTMHYVYDGDVDAVASDVMAEHVVGHVSEWLDAELGTQDSIAAFLLACSTGDNSFTGVDPNDIVMYSIIIGGELLSRYRPDGMRWFEYLDQIWNYAESQPDPA